MVDGREGAISHQRQRHNIILSFLTTVAIYLLATKVTMKNLRFVPTTLLLCAVEVVEACAHENHLSFSSNVLRRKNALLQQKQNQQQQQQQQHVLLLSSISISISIPRGGGRFGKFLQRQQEDISQTSSIETRGGAKAPSKRPFIVMGILLAFNSGFINGCCLSGLAHPFAPKQAVAAVTSSYTNSALSLATGNYDQFVFFSKIVASFVTGSAIAGVMNPRPVPFDLLSISAAWPFAIAAFLLTMAASLLTKPESIRFGFCLCAMANGIQNSITSSWTQNLCRTTHLTGISSDIGTFFGQWIRGNTANLATLQVFLGLAASFWLGGFISYGVFQHFASWSLWFSAVLYACVGWWCSHQRNSLRTRSTDTDTDTDTASWISANTKPRMVVIEQHTDSSRLDVNPKATQKYPLGPVLSFQKSGR